MTTTDQTIETLNDLVRINNDRIQGYQRAADETENTDADLKQLFRKMSDESYTYKLELEQKIDSLGGEVATGTTVSGKIYRAWMDVKNTFSGHNRKSILASCEYGEDKAQEAYKAALETDAELDSDTRKLIARQKASLKDSHDLIKRSRDMQQSVS
ncbi:MAG: PA2169 family four-helix-bundle protein [Chitinophagaceae bacterium]